MSTKTTVEVSEDVDGRVRAVDTESGATGKGDSVPEALIELARTLADVRDDVAALTERPARSVAERPVASNTPHDGPHNTDAADQTAA